ncbi:MAG TPA: hypothetical protein VFW95_09725 [Candidatus Limnocylindria bacterium]|nr:hypothetical protein [Candidatus Limnocylindria bacterium]
MRIRRVLLPVVVTLAAGCTTAGTQHSEAPIPSSPAPATTAPPSTAAAVGDPGKPYTGLDVLAAMRASRRPGGVPDPVETDAIATAIADAIWTFDGQPWSDLSAGGSCGAATCSIDFVGTRDGSSGEDVWSFEVAPADGSVQVVRRELGAVPDHVRDELDTLARSLVIGGQLDDLVLGSATWLAPPDAPAFALAYRSGNEEGSCAVDIVLDPVARRVLDSRASDC